VNARREPLHIDPLLAEVFELLHRMTTSLDQSLSAHAWSAIKKLQQYEAQQRQQSRSK
jgi:hypothetical protein